MYSTSVFRLRAPPSRNRLPPSLTSHLHSAPAFAYLTPALGSRLRSPQILIENMKARATPLTTSRVSAACLHCAAFICESAFIAHLNALCCEFCACGRYLLFHFAPACLRTACRISSPSRMLLVALLRMSRKHRSDRTRHRSLRMRREEAARGRCARTLREDADAHAPIDMLVECHRLDIFISDREIRFCASTPGRTTSAALYLSTEAGGVSDCF